MLQHPVVARGYSTDELALMRKKANRIKLIALAIGILIPIAVFFTTKHVRLQKEERIRIENARADSIRFQRYIDERVKIIENEARAQYQRFRSESIAAANRPSYSFSDVVNMVKAKKPSYSEAYLWRRDKDNWIAYYTRNRGGKCHEYMCRFNPTTGRWGEEIEVIGNSIRSSDNISRYNKYEYVCVKIDGRFVNDFKDRLTFSADGYPMETWNRDGLNNHWIPADARDPLNSQPEPVDELDGYEDAEDYYYDNVEDLYFYYNGDY